MGSGQIRVGSAPVSWGIFELTTGDENLIARDALLTAMRECAYSGTESGPPGYLGDAAEARDALDAHGLAFAGTFLPSSFSEAGWRERHRAELETALSFVAGVAGDDDAPVVLLSDAYLVAESVDGLDADGWRRTHAHVNEAAALCRDRGLTPAFHYHAGSFVETPEEIDRLVEGVDLDQIGLCFDSGHSVFGGGDPLDFLARYGSHVVHVHLKDVDANIMRGLRDDRAGLDEGWKRGVFCELGDGSVPVQECLEQLDAIGYQGWVIVEQDRLPTPQDSLSAFSAAAARNRGFLTALGL